MEALALKNSLAAASATTSAKQSRACLPIYAYCRQDVRRTRATASLGRRAPRHQVLRPCGSFSSESGASVESMEYVCAHMDQNSLGQRERIRQKTTLPISLIPLISLLPIEQQPSAPAALSADQPERSTQHDEGLNLDEDIALLKKAAKTRKVPATEVVTALCAVEKAKVDPSSFLATIGGSPEAPVPRTWMLVFTSSKEEVSESFKGGMGKGSYFPITAVQKFDAVAMTVENGAYLGPLGCIAFEGRISWKGRILAFLYDSVSIKIGPLRPFKFNIAKKEDKDRAPTNKDPFFVWHYADEEIIVARGRGGGLAFWCRCARVAG